MKFIAKCFHAGKKIQFRYLQDQIYTNFLEKMNHSGKM